MERPAQTHSNRSDEAGLLKNHNRNEVENLKFYHEGAGLGRFQMVLQDAERHNRSNAVCVQAHGLNHAESTIHLVLGAQASPHPLLRLFERELVRAALLGSVRLQISSVAAC